jgi:hypothetical protein
MKILLHGGSFATLRMLSKEDADALQRELDEITSDPSADRSGMLVKQSPEDQIAVPRSAIIGYHRREPDD